MKRNADAARTASVGVSDSVLLSARVTRNIKTLILDGELAEGNRISQEQLALKADLDRTYISSVERGTRNIAVINLKKIALALNTDPSELLNFQI